MKIHLDLMNAKDLKFTLTFSSAGEFRLFSPRAHWNRGVSRTPLFLRLWRHCWSFSSPLLLGFLFSLSLPPFTSAVVAAVSHPCPPHSRASRVSSPHWRHWAEFRSQDFLCKPTRPRRQLAAVLEQLDELRRGEWWQGLEGFTWVTHSAHLLHCKNIPIRFKKGSGRWSKMHP